VAYFGFTHVGRWTDVKLCRSRILRKPRNGGRRQATDTGSGGNDSAGIAESIWPTTDGLLTTHTRNLDPAPDTTVAKPAAPKKHLRLYTEQPPKPPKPSIESVACVADLCRSFQAATGWSMRADDAGKLVAEKPKVEKEGAVGGGRGMGETNNTESKKRKTRAPAQSSDHQISKSPILQITPPPSPIPLPLSVNPAPLARSISDLLGELIDTRRTLWEREAELAAGVPLVPHRQEEKHLAARLEAVLRAGAEAVGGDAAAVYMLDEGTSQLKLRASWGLPFDRMTAQARPLPGAMADLEALLGHAVVLDENLMHYWNAPENFAAAVCVPIASPTTLLGTLWLFSAERRDFNARETNLLEVVAGRVAADLEREMLLRVGAESAGLQREVAAAERIQRNSLPMIAPILDGWDAAGWAQQAVGVGGAFYDWFCLPNGLLGVSIGKAGDQGLAGALTAGAVKTAVRAHAKYHRQPESIVQQTNLTLWTGSAGDQRAELFCGLVETATGRVGFSSASRPVVLRLRPDGCDSLSACRPILGKSPEAEFAPANLDLEPGEALVVLVGDLRISADAEHRLIDEATLARALRSKLDQSAEDLVEAGRALLDSNAGGRPTKDWAVFALKRAPA
jgi:phosphoserine phosphatase RsbU/P